MMTNEESPYIGNLMTPGQGVLSQDVAIKVIIVKIHYFFKNFSSTLVDGSEKHGKTVLMMCLLIPIVLTGYIAAFFCHC